MLEMIITQNCRNWIHIECTFKKWGDYNSIVTVLHRSSADGDTAVFFTTVYRGRYIWHNICMPIGHCHSFEVKAVSNTQAQSLLPADLCCQCPLVFQYWLYRYDSGLHRVLTGDKMQFNSSDWIPAKRYGVLWVCWKKYKNILRDAFNNCAEITIPIFERKQKNVVRPPLPIGTYPAHF